MLHVFEQKRLEPQRLRTKDHRQAARNTWKLEPGRPSEKNDVLRVPAQLRLARTHGTHGTHETKTKTKRSRTPGYGGSEKPDKLSQTSEIIP